MPDKSGRFKGISVPELPWLRDEIKVGDRVEVVDAPSLTGTARLFIGTCGTVARIPPDAGYVYAIENDAGGSNLYFYKEELRRV